MKTTKAHIELKTRSAAFKVFFLTFVGLLALVLIVTFASLCTNYVVKQANNSPVLMDSPVKTPTTIIEYMHVNPGTTIILAFIATMALRVIAVSIMDVIKHFTRKTTCCEK